MVKKLDLYKLGVVVEVNGQKSLATLQQVEKQSNSVQTSFKGLRGEIGSLKASLTGGGSGGDGGGLFGAISSGLQLLPGLNILAAGVGKVTDVMKSGVKIGFDYNRVMEEAQIGFEVMMKSRTKATQHLKQLDGLTLKSPFDLEVLIKGSELAQAFRFKTAEIQRLLLTTGDASRGVQEKFEGIITALGQIKTKGKLSFEEMNQLVERGVPAWDYLADEIAKVDKNIARLTGDKRTGAVQKMAERGLISSSGAIEALLRGMEADFGGIGERVSNETASGLESQMRDATRRVVGAGTKGLYGGYKELLRTGIATVSSDTVTGLANSLGGNSERLIGAGVGIAKNLFQGFTDYMEIQSPSRRMARAGADTVEGLENGLVDRTSRGFDRWSKALANAGGEAFIKAVEEISARLGIDPAWMLNVMAFESGISAKAANKGSSARGLIQFMNRTARGLGLNNSNQFLGMDAMQQLRYVERYFKPYAGKMQNQGDVYAAVAGPAALFRRDRVLYRRGSKEYNANRVWDVNRDGVIVANEIGGLAASRGQFKSVGGSSFAGGAVASFKAGTPVFVTNLDEVRGIAARDLSEHGGSVPRDAASIAAGLDVVAKLRNANADIPLTTNGDIGGFENVVIKPLQMLPPAMREVGQAAKASLGPIKGLIQAESRLSQLRGAMGQVAGMMPQQQVGKKRGFFSKMLGFAAPFLGFIPGVGPLLSTLAGIGSSALAGDWGGALMATAGGFASGGAFRGSGSTVSPAGNTTNIGGINLPNPGTAIGPVTTIGTTINTNLSNRYPARARGGPVTRGRAYLVGEHHPEVVQFGDDGYVHPSIEAFSRAANSGGGLAGSGKGGFWNSWREHFDRLAGAIEKFETMSPGEVLTKGAKTHPGAIGDGLMRAGARDPQVVDWMRRRSA
ncbi:MAG TPA: tape measure protein [Pyrinomonadaceae bacterium]|jgi:tape measure domain-containing protein